MFSPLVIGALVLLAGALGYAFWPSGTIEVPLGPGHGLIDSMEKAGRHAASKIVETKLGEAKAKQILKELAAALTDEPPPTPKS